MRLRPLAIAAALTLLGACSPNEPASSPDSTNRPSSRPTATNSGAANTLGACRPAAVPAAEQVSYCVLHDALAGVAADITARERAQPAPLVCAQLTPANNHRGTELLAPNAVKGALLFAQRLKELGAGCVTVAISYPLLLQDRSGGDGFANASKYLAYYRDLAAGLRDLGLKLNAESGVIFPQSEFTSLPVGEVYAALRASDDPIGLLRAGRVNVMGQIITTLQPDYLSMGSEPDVAASLIGDQRIAAMMLDPSRYAQDVAATVAALSPLIKDGRVKLGAGIGTWPNNAKAYVDALAKTNIDYVDLHVYPVHDGALARFVELAEAAKAAGKQVAVSEAWLFKATAGTTAAQWAPTLAKNEAAHWAPLDRAFIEILIAASRATGTTFVSFFDSLSFFAYGPDRPRAAADAVVAGRFTPTGEALRAAAR